MKQERWMKCISKSNTILCLVLKQLSQSQQLLPLDHQHHHVSKSHRLLYSLQFDVDV